MFGNPNFRQGYILNRDMLNPLDSDGVRTKTEEWNLVVDRL